MNKYYDYAASTPISDEVLLHIKPWEQHGFANPSASHQAALDATDVIQKTREVIADKIGAMPSEIIFTSGASESNNLAIKGIAFKYLDKKGHIITSSIEHKCVLNACSFLETLGFEITYIAPNSAGVIESSLVKNAIKESTILISIHHINNELGTIQPIGEYGAIAFENNIPFHTDAAQSFCKVDIDVDEMDIDMLSLSGHKIYGPKGIGALYVRDARDSELVPLIHGGGQEIGLRGGTSPTPLIVGLGAAVGTFPTKKSKQHQEFEQLILSYDFKRNGGVQLLDTTWNITFASDSEAKTFFLEHPWMVSQGSACNAMSNTPSHVLTAIGLDKNQARRTYRISLPPYKV